MKYSDIKKIKTFCVSLFSTPDWREVVTAIDNGTYDFEVDGVRFINSESIDQIMQDELSDDEYVLGCFNSWFLASVLNVDRDVIEAMQKAEAFEAIGKLIISLGKLEDLQEEYARQDGVGAHFNHYDNSEEELFVNGELFHVFDNH